MGRAREKNTKDEKYKMGGGRRGGAGEVRESSHDELGERREKSGNREGWEGDGTEKLENRQRSLGHGSGAEHRTALRASSALPKNIRK